MPCFRFAQERVDFFLGYAGAFVAQQGEKQNAGFAVDREIAAVGLPMDFPSAIDLLSVPQSFHIVIELRRRTQADAVGFVCLFLRGLAIVSPWKRRSGQCNLLRNVGLRGSGWQGCAVRRHTGIRALYGGLCFGCLRSGRRRLRWLRFGTDSSSFAA